MSVVLKLEDGKIGDGTAGPLQQWLIAFVARRFPEAGIEYWSTNDYRGVHDGEDLRPASPLPEDLRGAGCFVQHGLSEGRLLRVVLTTRQSVRLLAWAKTFGSPVECWAIARAISEALESVVVWGELPEEPVADPITPAPVDAFGTWLQRIEHALQVEEPVAPEEWRGYFDRGFSTLEAIEADRRADGVETEGGQ